MLDGAIEFQVGRGKYRVGLIGIPTDGGLIVGIFGGDKPHIGAVAIGIPRPSLKDPSKLSATSSVFTMTSHKDDEIARPASEKIAKELNQTAVVIAGVHVEGASEMEIRELLANAERAVDRLVAKFVTPVWRSKGKS
jgi:hypothetical protein